MAKNIKVETEEKVLDTSKSDVVNKKDKKNTKLVKPKKERKSIGKRIKETTSELKKVSWPTFGKVVKATSVVIVVVLFFTVVLFGIDYVLKLLFNLLTGSNA